MTLRAAVARSLLPFLPFSAVLVGLAAVADVRRNDFFQFWWAGHLVATGRSPYDPSAFGDVAAYGQLAGSLAANCAASVEAPACLWVYPPWTAWLYAPIGMLDPSTGVALVLAVSVAGLAAGTILIARWAGASTTGSAALLTGFALSAPAVRDVVTGHFEGLLLIGLVCLAAGLAGRAAALAVGAVVLTLKPHLGIALAALVAVWLVARTAYRDIAIGAAVVGTLLLSAAVLEPRALPAMLGRSGSKVGLTGSTTWDLAERIGGAAAPELALALVGIAAAGALAAWRGAGAAERPRALVVIGAALGLAVAPYAQSYDQVLLFPAVAFALRGATTRAIAGACAAMVAVTWGAYLLELSGDPRAYAGALPAASLAFLGARRAWR